jgi:hypothetical protein
MTLSFRFSAGKKPIFQMNSALSEQQGKRLKKIED